MKTPNPPKELSTDSKRLWRKVLADYLDLGTDSASLEVLRIGLLARDRAEKCRVQIDRDGEIIVDRFKQKKPHCLLAAERDARSGFLVALKQLGLDPAIGG